MGKAWLVSIVISVGACGGAPRTVAEPRSILERHAALAGPITNARTIAWKDIAVVARRAPGNPLQGAIRAFSGAFAAPTGVIASVAPSAPPEKLVIEAWFALQVDDVRATTEAIVKRVVASGGHVVSSNIVGRGGGSSAALELRMPPNTTDALAGFLAHAGVVESQRTQATDVGKQLVDQQLALENLHVTMARLEKLAERDDTVGALIQVEAEMTRVRGEIEHLAGEQRWLLDRIEQSTITVTLSREGGPIELDHARIYPGVRLATLTLLDAGARPETRLGGGASLRIKRWLTFDLDVFPRQTTDTRAVLATLGTAIYSDTFGGGRRGYLDPYLGVRFGYGYLSGEGGALFEAELGVELLHRDTILVEIAARSLALTKGTGTEVGFEGVAGVGFPF